MATAATTAQASTSASASAGVGTGLRKATLACSDLNQDLTVHFNPSSLTISKAAVVTAGPQAGATHGSTPQHVNTHTRQLNATLVFDAWVTGRSVADAVSMLQNWLNPTEDSLARHTPHAPRVELEWNASTAFPGYLTSATATYSQFARDGTPVRCSVQIQLQEVPDPPPPTNPTSGGARGRRTRLVRAGESLQAIAYAEYHDPTLWRVLALANGVYDPLRLQPGLRLEIPPPAHAPELLP